MGYIYIYIPKKLNLQLMDSFSLFVKCFARMDRLNVFCYNETRQVTTGMLTSMLLGRSTLPEYSTYCKIFMVYLSRCSTELQ